MSKKQHGNEIHSSKSRVPVRQSCDFDGADVPPYVEVAPAVLSKPVDSVWDSVPKSDVECLLESVYVLALPSRSRELADKVGDDGL